MEGWHTGHEWIDSGSLLQRINFAADWVSDIQLPGIESIVNKLAVESELTSEELVDGCLDLLGPIIIDPSTRQEVILHIEKYGSIKRGTTEEDHIAFNSIVSEVLRLIASTREFQLG